MGLHGNFHGQMTTLGGHPAMEVTIEMQFRRASKRSARELGVSRGARLIWLVLCFLAFLLALLGQGQGPGRGL
jgi:hypothetical protein